MALETPKGSIYQTPHTALDVYTDKTHALWYAIWEFLQEEVARKAIGVYERTNARTEHGCAVFKAKKKSANPRYISRDRNDHGGGAWKGADSVGKLDSRGARSGTYDKFMRRIGP